MDMIKKAYEIVRKKGNLYSEKDDSNWISYIDNDDYIQTFDHFGDDSFCEDCIDKKIIEINKIINNKDNDIEIPSDFSGLTYQSSLSAEGTGFHHCDECGEIIHQSIIWDKQEIEHWLNIKDKEWKKMNGIHTHFELMTILDSVDGAVSEFPKETLKIAEKVIKFIKH